MRIIISPAKKMVERPDVLPAVSSPQFLNEAKVLMEWIQGLTYAEAKTLWQCNDNLTALNVKRFQHMDLSHHLTPALISYEGIQYQAMAPDVFTDDALRYVQEHLRILSGFYGVLRPMDGVTPYRLEMQAKVTFNDTKDLYDFWQDRLYRSVLDDDRIIINLASREYAKSIQPYLSPEDTFITCIFGELSHEKVIQKATPAKIARGSMVRYLAENAIQAPEEIKSFHVMGYQFQPQLSSTSEYVFLKG